MLCNRSTTKVKTPTTEACFFKKHRSFVDGRSCRALILGLEDAEDHQQPCAVPWGFLPSRPNPSYLFVMPCLQTTLLLETHRKCTLVALISVLARKNASQLVVTKSMHPAETDNTSATVKPRRICSREMGDRSRTCRQRSKPPSDAAWQHVPAGCVPILLMPRTSFSPLSNLENGLGGSC